MSHAIDYAVWGLNPFGHHLTNILLHTINTYLVSVLAIRLIERAQGSAVQEGRKADAKEHMMIAAGIVGFLFGLHPLHVESVAWVAERKDLLCALFFLLSILAYSSYVLQEKGKNFQGSPFSPLVDKKYLFSFGFFIAALLSKPMAVTLPLVLLILDWYPLQRMRVGSALQRIIVEKLPFFALSMISSILTILAQKTGDSIASIESIPLSVRLLVAAKSLVDYLARMALPIRLVPFYPYPEVKSVSLAKPAYIFPLFFLAGITLLCILLAKKKQKLYLSGWSYFVITLLPVLGIMQVGSQATADRYTYLPCLGPFLIVGVTVSQLAEKIDAQKRIHKSFRALITAVAIVMMVSLIGLTFEQIRTWRNTIILWTHAIETRPGVTNAYLNRALAYKRRGLLDEAIHDYNTAISLNPVGFIAHYNLGNIYLSEGRIDESIEQYQMAVNAKPDYAECHNNLGVAYNDKGWTDQAIEQYHIALALKPDFADGHYNLGQAYSAKGLLDKAIEQYEIAVRLEPGNQEFKSVLSSARAKKIIIK
jgi:protein O-mannosyl-transferase